MLKKIFYMLAAVLLVAGMTANADAACFDKNGKYDPVAIADATGTVVTQMPTGEMIRVRGFKAGAEVCRNLLFQTAGKKCPSGQAALDAPRDPKFCKGVGAAGTCVHIVCDKRT